MTRGFRDEDLEVKRSDLVDIEAEVRRETDHAWLVFNGAVEAWLPKSQVERDGRVFTLPEWLAREKRLLDSADRHTGRLI